MQEAGYEILDASDQFDEGVVEIALLAMAEDFQIEFLILPSVQQATAVFQEYKNTFEQSAGSTSSYSSVSVSNYSTYKLSTNGNTTMSYPELTTR